jgi:two-component system, LuxR family, sensor kinase FixL
MDSATTRTANSPRVPVGSTLKLTWPGVGNWLQSENLRYVGAFCIFEIVFYLSYRCGLIFNWTHPAPFWFPNAVLLCGLLQIRPRRWWLLLLATLPIRFMVALEPARPLLLIFIAYAIDCASAVSAALLLRRFLPNPVRFTGVRDFGVYCLLTVLLTSAGAGLAGAAERAAYGLAQNFWLCWRQWFFGDALGYLIVAPFLFYWVMRPPDPRTIPAARWIEGLVLAGGLGFSMFLAFQPVAGKLGFTDLHLYLPIAFLVWSAVRFGMRGATAAAALLSYFAMSAALSGSPLFAGNSPADMAATLQEFLFLRVAPLYLVAVLIEQTRLVELSLRDSESRFRSLADTAPVLVWSTGKNGLCEYFNKGWLDFTGRTHEQEIGRGWMESLHPDDRQGCIAVCRASFAARESFEMEFRLRRRDGEYRWTLDRGVPRYGADGKFLGYIGCSIDVTDRRQQEAALRRSEVRYRDLVESQTDFVCRFLSDTTLTFVNSAYCQFLGRPREELLGTRLTALMPACVGDIVSSRVEQTAQLGQPSAWESELRATDGSQQWQHWICHAIPAVAGGSQELQAIGRDITDRKRVDIANRNLAHTARLATFGELTALIAHEINQPLCSILSNAETAELLLRSENPPKDELLAILADIRDADLRADETIRGIRALARKREIQLMPLDLNITIADVLRLASGDALYRRVHIRRRVHDPLPLVVGDRAYIEQVLLNLIVNGMDAMKDCPEAERELTVEARCHERDTIEVIVSDCGHGIAAEKMPHLFDSFFTTKSEGVGLGLSIARSVIQAHSGRIWAENRAAGGAAFHFTLRTAGTEGSGAGA